MLAGAARHASRAALFPIGVAVFLAAASAAATASRAPMASRPIVFVNAYGTYSVRSDGTGWRQLNECTLNPIATNGRQLVGGFNHLSDSSAPLVLLPADREVVNDCDSGPRDPSVLRYRLRVKGSRVTWWTGFAWSPDGRRILSVGQLGSGSSSTSRALVFNADGSGYHVLEPSLDGVQSNVSAGAWSPRGDRIVFGRTFKGSDCPEFAETKTVAIGCSRAELAVMDADGSNARSLYRPPQIESSQVDLLPAGSTLRKLPTVSYRPFAWYRGRVFVLAHEDASTRRADISERIAVLSEEGTGFRYLSPPGSVESRPALSPDGRQIAWIGLPGCTKGQPQPACTRSPQLYVVSTAGGRVHRVAIKQPLTSATCSRGSLPGTRTCASRNIGFDQVAW